MLYLGIDPGGSGGFALIASSGSFVSSHPAKASIPDVLAYLRNVSDCGSTAVIETVSAFTGQGAQASFKFGESFGILRCAVIAAGIPLREVSPGVWQREFALPSLRAAGSKTAKKNAHKARAQELFPGVSVTHAIADALLLAEWLRRHHDAPTLAPKPRPARRRKIDDIEDLFAETLENI